MTNQTENIITQKIEYIRGRLYIASIMLILSIIQLCLMGYWYMLMYKKDSTSLIVGDFLFFPFLIVIFFNIYLLRILFLIMQLQPFRGSEIKKILTVWCGSVSLIGFFLDFAAISDIRKEHLTGIYDCSLEFGFLTAIFFFHMIFYILFAKNLIIAIFYLKKNQDKDIYIYNENNFNRFNIIGFFSGLLGIICTLLLTFIKEPLINWKWMILPYCLLLLSPYFLYLTHWVLSIKKEKRHKFLDEKQQRDLFKASITTLILSLPALVIFFLFNYHTIYGPGSILWLPFYLFSTLLIFSGATIFFYKKN
jgi:hypothetical protein